MGSSVEGWVLVVWENHDHRWVLAVWENHDHRWVLTVWQNHDHRWVLCRGVGSSGMGKP